jgi:hypothetical protein
MSNGVVVTIDTEKGRGTWRRRKRFASFPIRF